MICILKMEGAELIGWIIATDVDDARRQASAAFDNDLAGFLYQLPPYLKPGKHDLPTGHVMLVS